MRITDTLTVDETEIEERFVRASGPGGQHVNKTESAVQLRFDVRRSAALDEAVKRRLTRLAGSRMTQDGVLVIRADTHRSRERNRADARERLRSLVERALTPPKPRRKSRPSLSSIRKQKEAKAQRSKTKARRRKPGLDD
ncbi:alternative ribosome rescue aminoacyl-tRNA hydrolase ArfB [Maricaulis sp.]|uniref:alternative ribosome rescue aminoacyl-tRNA hydrolase ArfB n=1 Tax=Maricaulis sp. TaxID=1486257 RepID=UPI0026316E3D|nr:alternative ribosome rescue aminoacyl-tRNA hydrolase ArfB [Maricaulis sp.]